MRRHQSIRDAAVLLGILLLFWSITSAFVDPDVLPLPDSLARMFDDGSARPKVLKVITPTRPAAVAQPASTLTPFQPIPPTLAPGTVPQSAAPLATATEPLPVVTIPPFATDYPLIDPLPTSEVPFLVPATAVPTVLPTAAPNLAPLVPDRIVIPAINLDAQIIPSTYQLVEFDGQVYQQWDAPSQYAVGWQFTSAFLGASGNTVLDGHHNIYGSVFGRLIDLTQGDTIQVFSGGTVITYRVDNKMILPERDQAISVRLDNARWLQASTDERLTLVTCWPEWTNTHRLILVAVPVSRGEVAQETAGGG